MSYVQSQIDYQTKAGTPDVDLDAPFHVDFVCRRLIKEAAFYTPWIPFIIVEGYDGPFTKELDIYTKGSVEDRTGVHYTNTEIITASFSMDLINETYATFCNPSGEEMVEFFINVCTAVGLCTRFDQSLQMQRVSAKLLEIIKCYKLVEPPAEQVWAIRDLTRWLLAKDNAFMLSLRNVTRFRELQQWQQLRPLLQDLERELQRDCQSTVKQLSGQLLRLFEEYKNSMFAKSIPNPPMPYFIQSTTQGGLDQLCPPGDLFKLPLVRELMAQTAKKSGKSPLRVSTQMKKLAKLFLATDIHAAYDAEYADMAMDLWRKQGKPTILYNPLFIHSALNKMNQNPRQGIPKSVIAAVISVAMSDAESAEEPAGGAPEPAAIPTQPLERMTGRDEAMATKRGVTFADMYPYHQPAAKAAEAEAEAEAGGGGGGGPGS